MPENLLTFKGILADFVKVKYPDNRILFENLFSNEQTLRDIIKTIDENWIPATDTQDGLFTSADKILLTELGNTAGINIHDLAQGITVENIHNVHLAANSSLTLEYIDNDSVKLDIDELRLFEKIIFNSDNENACVNIELNQGVFEIKSRSVVFISDEYRTNYEIPHTLGTNININIFEKIDQTPEESGGWSPVIANYKVSNDMLYIYFKEAVKCKVHLTLI